MKRIHLTALLLALVLLLVGCTAKFERDGDGYGFTNKKTDVHYTVLSGNFEAAAQGEQVGEHVDEKFDYTTLFYEIPGLDADRFVADGDGQVYCADDTLPNAAELTVSSVLVCDEDEISIALVRWTEAKTVSAVRDAWFSGEEAELPFGAHTTFYRMKLTFAEYPGIYYCFGFYAYADGSAYFYDIGTARSVACPAEITALVIG